LKYDRIKDQESKCIIYQNIYIRYQCIK